jgi:hypothetical protein
MKNFKVILSSTVLVLDGTYSCNTLTTVPDVADLPHHIGHPATKEILNSLGAVHTPGNFSGLAVGDSMLVVSLANNQRAGGFTTHQDVDIMGLTFKVVTRIA